MPLNYEDSLRFDPLVVEQDNISYWRDRFEQRRDLVASPIVAKILTEYYEDDSEHFYEVSYDGMSRRFPVFTKDEWSDVSLDPDHVINSVDEEDWGREHDKQFIWDTCMQQASLALDPDTTRQQIEVRDYVWNNPLYRIDTVHNEPDSKGFRFDIGMTDYYTYVSQATRIVEELYDHCQRFGVRPESDPEEAKNLLVDRLQFRDKIAPSFDSMASEPNHPLGTLVTTMFRMPDGTHYVVLVDRASTTVDYPDTIGIAPSGVSAPLYDASEECDLEYLILREFGEEVFTREEFRRSSEDVDSKDWITTSAPVRELRRLLRGDGGTDIRVTGFAYNCLSGASQVSALLYIEDPTYAEWLYDHVTHYDQEMMEGSLRLAEVDDAMRELLKAYDNDESDWAPGAAVALSQSVNAAARKENGPNLR